jgi:hypothetical protein
MFFVAEASIAACVLKWINNNNPFVAVLSTV